MKWAIKIGEFAGIGVFLHWTFLVFIAWILFYDLSAGQGINAAVQGVAFILAIFACVVLHEFGHALMARRFGIRTRDITLLPIGGVARLERIPEQPLQEFLVAVAGPAVNVVIAILLAIVVTAGGGPDLEAMKETGGGFLTRLLLVNVGLVIFNMIPAFPMDGGRALRAILSSMMGHLRATDTAATVGQFIAILFGVLGFFTNGMLIFIALFIYLGAQQEAQMAHVRALLHGVPVRHAMTTMFRTVSVDDLLDTAERQFLAGDQKDFPVLDHQNLVGMLRAQRLVELGDSTNSRIRVGDVMQRDCKVVEVTSMLQEVFEQMQHDGCSTLPVVQKGKLVGIVSLENIGTWLMAQSGRKNGGFS
ncbi:MAG: site-2 protease family protein [Planctomycetes bacterium]|nr:site-2 protease family protein [Planctomycetota bacterium]